MNDASFRTRLASRPTANRSRCRCPCNGVAQARCRHGRGVAVAGAAWAAAAPARRGSCAGGREVFRAVALARARRHAAGRAGGARRCAGQRIWSASTPPSPGFPRPRRPSCAVARSARHSAPGRRALAGSACRLATGRRRASCSRAAGACAPRRWRCASRLPRAARPDQRRLLCRPADLVADRLPRAADLSRAPHCHDSHIPDPIRDGPRARLAGASAAARGAAAARLISAMSRSSAPAPAPASPPNC